MLELVLFVAIAIVLFWIASVSNRLAVLERELKKGTLGQAASFQPAAAKQPPQPSAMPAATAPSAAPKQEWMQPAARPPQIPLRPKTEAEDAEAAAGWLNKIGITAVVIGMAFFFKYAIDQGWINEWTRIIIGLVVAGLLLVLGEMWREKYGEYANGLSGGGIAIAYFSIYAAYNFYHLIPHAAAFTVLVGITALSVFLSYRYKSQTLAALGIIGAYGAPILLNTGQNNQALLFWYLTLLNLAIVAVMIKNFGMELLALAFLGYMADFSLWASSYSSAANTFNSMIFLSFALLVFMVGSAALFRKHHTSGSLPKNSDTNFALLSAIFGAFYFISSYLLLVKNYHDYLPGVGIIAGLIYLISYVVVDRLNYDQINYSLTFLAGGFLAAAAYWQFHGFTLDLAVLALGLVAVTTTVVTKRAEFRVAGIVLMFFAVLSSLIRPYDLQAYIFIFNQKFGMTCLEILSLLYASWTYRNTPGTNFENSSEDLLKIIASMLLWFGFSWEITTNYRGYAENNIRNLLLSLWWIAYAVILMVVGSVTRAAIYRKISVGLFALSIIKVFTYDVASLEIGYRIVSFIVLGVILLSVSFAYQRNKEKIGKFLEGEKEKVI